MKRLYPPKVKGIKNSKQQTTKHYKKPVPKHSNNFLYVAIRVQRWFVELQVVLL